MPSYTSLSVGKPRFCPHKEAIEGESEQSMRVRPIMSRLMASPSYAKWWRRRYITSADVVMLQTVKFKSRSGEFERISRSGDWSVKSRR